MKYKVGDKVMCGDLSGIVYKIDEYDYYDLLIEWDAGNRSWRNSGHVSPDYRALYEQEKALKEALLSILRFDDPLVYDPIEKMKAMKHYQQLKQQYNGKETKSNTTNDA